MTRTILVLAVIGAFVIGSIATGTIAFAQDGDEGGVHLKRNLQVSFLMNF